jgi:hypothetical protein
MLSVDDIIRLVKQAQAREFIFVLFVTLVSLPPNANPSLNRRLKLLFA